MGGTTLVCTLEVQAGGERTQRTFNVEHAPRTLRELTELLKEQDLRLQYGSFNLCVDRRDVKQRQSQSQSESELQAQQILCDRDVVELFATPPPHGRLNFLVTLSERSTKVGSSMLADDELVDLCIYHPSNHNSHDQKITEVGKNGEDGEGSGNGGKATRTVTEKRFIPPRRGVREALVFAVRGAIPQPLPLSVQLELYAVGADEHDLRLLNDEAAVNLLMRSCLADHKACRLTYRLSTDIAAERVAPAAVSKPENKEQVAAATVFSDPTTGEAAESNGENSTEVEDASEAVHVFDIPKRDFATKTDVSDPIKDETTEVVSALNFSERYNSPHEISISVLPEVTLVAEPVEPAYCHVSVHTESFSIVGDDTDLPPLCASDAEPSRLWKPHLIAEEVKEPEEVLKEDGVTATSTNLLPFSKIEIECSLHRTNVVVFPFSWQPNETNMLETLQTACAYAFGITSIDDVRLYNHEGAPVLTDEQTCAMLDAVLQEGRTRIRLLLGLCNPCTSGLPLHCYITWGKQEVVLTCAVRPETALEDLENAILEEFNVKFRETGTLKLLLRDAVNDVDEELTTDCAYLKLKTAGEGGVVLHVLVSSPCPSSLCRSPEPTVTTAAVAFATEVSFVVGDRVHAHDVLPFFEECLDLQSGVESCSDRARDFARVMVFLLTPPGGRQLPPAELVALLRDTAAIAAAKDKELVEAEEQNETKEKEERKKTSKNEKVKGETEDIAAAVEAVERAAVVARLFAARRPLDTLARLFRRVFRSLLPADGGHAVPLALVTRHLALAGLPDAGGLLRRDRAILAELQEKDYTELLLRLYNSHTDVVRRAVVAARLTGTSIIRSRRLVTGREEELMRSDFLHELRHVFDGIRTSDMAKFLQTHELITEPRFQCLLSVVGELLATHTVECPHHWLVHRFKGKMADALDVRLRTFEDSTVSTPQLYNLCWNVLKPELHHLSLLSESRVGSAFACWAFFAVQLVCVNRKLEFPPVPLVDLQGFSLVKESTATTTFEDGDEPTEVANTVGVFATPGTAPTPSSVVGSKLAALLPSTGKKAKIKYKYSYLCQDLRKVPHISRPVK